MLALVFALLIFPAKAETGGIGGLVEKYSEAPSVLEYDSELNRYQLRIFSSVEVLKERLELNSDFLENPYFKIVEGEADEVLGWSDFDGRNVMFHLLRARTYFLRLDPTNSALDKKITIRVRMSRAFNLVTKYAHREDYNNSRYIGLDKRGRWGAEIWFDLPRSKTDFSQIVISGVAAAARPGWGLLLFPLAVRNNHFSGLDTAKIPSVIYHEAFHWASVGVIPYRAAGNPVAEDFANYFAASLNGKPAVAEIPDFADRRTRKKLGKIRKINGRKKMFYNHQSVIPSVLWQLRTKILGQELSDKLVWSALKQLPPDMKPSDVPNAILTALDQHPDVPEILRQQAMVFIEIHRAGFKKLDDVFAPYYEVAKSFGAPH